MKKYILYPVTALVTGFGLFAGLFWGAKIGALYSVFWGILAAFGGLLIARLVVHLIAHDRSKAFLATMVWGVIAEGLFCWLILNTYSWLQTALVFSIMTAVLNYFGFRYICTPEEVIPEVKEESRKEKVTRLAAEMRYEMVGDTPQLDKPLCEVEGVALTPAEAEEKGYGAIAANGLEYIKKYVKEGK